MKQSQRIVKNLVVILLSEMIGYVALFAVNILLARYLGTVGFGRYSFVIAFVSVFQVIADSGLGTIMTREISVDKNRLAHQLGVTKSLLWVFSIVVFAAIAAVANIARMEVSLLGAIYVFGIALIAMIHAYGYISVFRAMEEMEYIAYGSFIYKTSLLLLIVLVIKMRLGLIEIAWAYLVSTALLWFFYYVTVSRRYSRPKMIIDLKAWRHFIVEAIPVGVAGILRRVSWQVDILILSAIGTAASVGLFSAPYKIIQSLNMLANTLSVPLFPHFSRLAKKSTGDLLQLHEKSLKFLFLLSTPMVVLLFVLSNSIVTLAFGPSFSGSSIALQILSVTLLFLFPSAQFVYLFSALGRQRLFAVGSVAAISVNIILDFLLIPEFGIVGACLGTLVAEVMLFGMSVFFLKSIDRQISFLRASWKPIVSGLCMWAALYPFSGRPLPWMLVGTLLSGLVYLAAIMLLRTFSREEFQMIREGIRFGKKNRGDVRTGEEVGGKE